MPRSGDDDREAIDRAFADLVAGYHLTSDRPDPLIDPAAGGERTASDQAPEPGATTTEAAVPDSAWADQHPLFHYEEPAAAEEAESEPDEDFVPEPLMPLPRPTWPALVAWIAMGYAVICVLAATAGLQLPVWMGWTALLCFVGGFGVLVARLPRHRPPDAGNGAVL